MMFHVIGGMAEFERELIRERVKAALAHARSKGQKLGRPKVRRESQPNKGWRASGGDNAVRAIRLYAPAALIWSAFDRVHRCTFFVPSLRQASSMTTN